MKLLFSHSKTMATLVNSLRASSPGALGALGGGKRKGSLQLRLWNLNICIEKVDAKCRLAEMSLVMTSLPLAPVFQCLFTSVLVPPRADWRKSDSSVDVEPRELEVEFKFQRRSCKLSFLFPPRRQSAPESLLAGYSCQLHL